jgi:hypothetical protein
MKHLLLLFRRDIHALEYDPAAQYKFHFFWTWVWFLAMIALPFFPTLWGYSVPALIIQEISLWANFATHFGAMSAALAAKHTKPDNQELKRLIVSQGIVNTEEQPTDEDIKADLESGLLE